MATTFEEIVRLIDEHGETAYFGEPVSQREHALQTAWLAEREGAAAALIVAALLHDVGHLGQGQEETVARLRPHLTAPSVFGGPADTRIDARHETEGSQWLSHRFGPEVAEPARLHVEAKRYLCAIDPQYAAGLSPASQQSLALQGGPLTANECATFEAKPHAAEAVRLRRWDDRAKEPGLTVPNLDHYRPRIEAMVQASDQAS